MYRLKKVISLFVILFIVFAVILPRLPELLMVISGSNEGPIKPLEVEVASFSVKNIGMSGLEGIMYFRIHNPNAILAIVDRITYNIYDGDGNLLAQGETPRSYTVPAQSTITIQNDISVGWVGALNIVKSKIKSLLIGEKEIWKVEGIIYINIGPATFNIPFTANFEV